MDLEDILYYLRVINAIAQRIETVDPGLKDFCQTVIGQSPYVLSAEPPPDQSAIDRVYAAVLGMAPSVTSKPVATPPTGPTGATGATGRATSSTGATGS